MAQNIKLIVYPVKNVQEAKVFYGKFLGIEPYADSPYYVGFKPTDDLEIGLDPNSQEIVSYIEVTDIENDLQALVAAGATLHQASKDVGGGMLIAQVKDAGGNTLGLRQLPQ